MNIDLEEFDIKKEAEELLNIGDNREYIMNLFDYYVGGNSVAFNSTIKKLVVHGMLLKLMNCVEEGEK